jgi:S1-C subfamily serine protease
VTYDETWDDVPARRFPLAAVAVVLALGALATAMYVVVRQSTITSAERTARQDEVGKLEQRVAALESRNAALSGRLGSAEKSLKQKDGGIAPLAKRVLKSVFTVETDSGLGTGFVAWRDSTGTFIVTANHVVADQLGTGVQIYRKGAHWTGEIAGTDPKHDLAVIRMEGQPAGAEPLWQAPRRTLPQTGDELLLVGSPYGLYGTVTTGVVSRVSWKVIQTDAAANPGNSGGPALDKHGHVVGVLVAGGGENLNFAIPIRQLCLKLRSC